MSDISFFVPGLPASKGSYNISRTGKPYPADKNLRKWEESIGWIARQHYRDDPTESPMEARLTFFFGDAPGLKIELVEYEPAPNIKTGKPDIDKLVRAALDGMTGIIYRDDAQVFMITGMKINQ